MEKEIHQMSEQCECVDCRYVFGVLLPEATNNVLKQIMPKILDELVKEMELEKEGE